MTSHNRVRRTTELPDDVGDVFLTDVPNAPFLIHGRRDPTSGELFVHNRYEAKPDVSMADLVAEIKQQHDVEVEIVADEEAEQLIRRMQLEDNEWSNEMPPPRASDWGGWRVEGLELVYSAYPGGGVYPIDLERFTDSAEVLNMIVQVAKKNWATDACVAGMVRALNDLLQPQAHLCSCGANKQMTAAQIKKMVTARCS